ncbi:hypothetical protein BKA93DRAFT_840752 [Sparassis latifolia]
MDGRLRKASHLTEHEQTLRHRACLEEEQRALQGIQDEPLSHSANPELELVDDAMRNLLRSMAQPETINAPEFGANSIPRTPPSPIPSFNWHLFEATEDTMLLPSAEQEQLADLAQQLQDYIDGISLASDDDIVERSDSGHDSGCENEPMLSDARSREWFPWHDRVTCTLDILMHLPRSVFSQCQLDLFLWLLKVNGVDDVPSVKSMQSLNTALQKMCGIDSIAYKGALGHNYYVNSLPQIIAQEMANPKVRPHLHFYPEDRGNAPLSEGRQAERWLHKIPDEQLTPMARIRDKDYFIHEPAMLTNGLTCMPVRWFTRVKDKQHVLYAKCWEMQTIATENGSGWRVVQREDFLVPETMFMKNFPELRGDAQRLYGLPDPACIDDVVDRSSGRHMPWTFTDPTQGNRWRTLANGHRAVGFGIWMYCDDTSGNLSKKWNAHNSFLFTPAGLPCTEAQREYNIHFMATSNIAPLLEMLDGIVEQLEDAQKNGIWAWDCEKQEPVLLVPFVLAFLGDNPMQSEFACHIGLCGKLFCRACWVKGHDALQDNDGGLADQDNHSGASDNEGSEVASDEGSDVDVGSETEARSGKKKGRRKKAFESMSNMVERVKAFIKVGKPRNKKETTDKLRSYFENASTLGTQTKVANMRTESGIKDTYQKFFLDKLFDSYKKKRGTKSKQDALDAALASLPDDIISPVWRIKGFDPHCDTPVEILHVILLGFVKYMWRDVVQNQLKNKDDKKNLLATCLSSLDVSGLGISALAGNTLVQYCGSLTGRDFCAIAQAAPFVIYDLVPADCLETWVALSKLIPLIWQPEIENLDVHLNVLEHEMRHFMLCAARWTIRWFNKPKFHIFLHLIEHIRWFEPAILFATEAFESFNAIIRAKSGNRIRHLMSGGSFALHSAGGSCTQEYLDATELDRTPSNELGRFSDDPGCWKSIGVGPHNLVHGPSTVTHFLNADRYLFKSCQSANLYNGDSCDIGQYVIVRDPVMVTETYVARVEEIVQVRGSIADLASQPDAILLRTAAVFRHAEPYHMPRVDLLSHWQVAHLQDILCTVNNNCNTSSERRVHQERQVTEQTRPKVKHLNAADVVLNTAQMRDAAHVQKFRIAAPELDADQIITASAAREVTAQRAKERQTVNGNNGKSTSTSDGAGAKLNSCMVLASSLGGWEPLEKCLLSGYSDSTETGALGISRCHVY